MNNTNQWYQDALLVNRDPDWIFRCLNGSSREKIIESIEAFFSMYGGHKITDVLLCVYEQVSFIPSEIMEWMGGKYEYRFGYENDVYYPVVEKLYKCCIEYGIDYVDIFIRKMKEFGIRPWITLRMNDAHYNGEKSLLRSEMKEEEIALGHVIGEAYGYYGRCFDFSYPHIREAFLGYIGEILDKYDFFGLELDFMREIFCFDFKNDPECHKIMTEFIRQIKSLIENAEKRVGHPLKLMLRTHRSVKDALKFGFDVKTLCEEGILDAVNPTPRWECTDSAIPVAEWRKLVRDDIALFPGLEVLNLKKTLTEPEQAKAYAAAFYAQGADGLYLNNYFDGSIRDLGVWNITPQQCLEGQREFTVTYQEKELSTDVTECYTPFPMSAEDSIALELGKINAKDRVTVIVDFEGDEYPTLSVGAIKEVRAEKRSPIIIPKNPYFGGDAVMTENTALSYNMSGIETDCTMVFTFNGRGRIHYMNIVIKAANENEI